MASASASLPVVNQPPSPDGESVLAALDNELYTTPSKRPSSRVPSSDGDMGISPTAAEGAMVAPLPQQPARQSSASSQGGPQIVAHRGPVDVEPSGANVRFQSRTPSTIGGVVRDPQENRRSNFRDGRGPIVMPEASVRRWTNPTTAVATIAGGARGRLDQAYPPPLPADVDRRRDVGGSKFDTTGSGSCYTKTTGGSP